MISKASIRDSFEALNPAASAACAADRPASWRSYDTAAPRRRPPSDRVLGMSMTIAKLRSLYRLNFGNHGAAIIAERP
jgi:hypothetical protein